MSIFAYGKMAGLAEWAGRCPSLLSQHANMTASSYRIKKKPIKLHNLVHQSSILWMRVDERADKGRMSRTLYEEHFYFPSSML